MKKVYSSDLQVTNEQNEGWRSEMPWPKPHSLYVEDLWKTYTQGEVGVGVV